MEATQNYSIILFDGVCNFCNASVNRVISNDKKNKFKFAALQSEKGIELSRTYNLDITKLDTMVLIKNGEISYKSTAALKTAKHMDKLYPLLYGLIIIPAFIRNAVYDLIARNRYKWFGKKDSCMIPSKEVRDKFVF